MVFRKMGRIGVPIGRLFSSGVVALIVLGWGEAGEVREDEEAAVERGRDEYDYGGG